MIAIEASPLRCIARLPSPSRVASTVAEAVSNAAPRQMTGVYRRKGCSSIVPLAAAPAAASFEC
jgi:hypothetical protein